MLVWEFEWTNDESTTTESEDDDIRSSCEQYNSHLHYDSEISSEDEPQFTDSNLPTQL